MKFHCRHRYFGMHLAKRLFLVWNLDTQRYSTSSLPKQISAHSEWSRCDQGATYSNQAGCKSNENGSGLVCIIKLTNVLPVFQ